MRLLRAVALRGESSHGLSRLSPSSASSAFELALPSGPCCSTFFFCPALHSFRGILTTGRGSATGLSTSMSSASSHAAAPVIAGVGGAAGAAAAIALARGGAGARGWMGGAGVGAGGVG